MDTHCSSGPVTSMPGSTHSVPLGAMCDRHVTVPAVKRVQGETDSFGCEYILACDRCAADLRRLALAPRSGVCDWCGQAADDLRKRRDYDEGMSGRLYDVCGKCAARDNEQWAAELTDRYDDWD